MDNGGGDPPGTDQNKKEMSISLAASSMINAADMINREAYQANLKRIREVKEMVRRLEVNNEAAHKNFLVGQLEKRAKDGRDAEIMLKRLRNQPESSETIQCIHNGSNDRSEVILPTTATLVEVPESHSNLSHSSSAPMSHSPQIIRHDHLAKYQWSLPPRTDQSSYSPGVFHYVPPPMAAQHAPHFKAPVDQEQRGWSAAQGAVPQYMVHNPLAHHPGFQPAQVHQSTSSWNYHPHQAIPLPAGGTIPIGPRHYTLPSEPTRRAPIQDNSNTSSFSPVHSTNPPPLTPAPRVQVPLQGIPAGPAKPSSGQTPPIRSQPMPTESHFQSNPSSVSKSIVISNPQRPHKAPQYSEQQQTETQPPRPSQPLPQPPSQQHHQQPQPQLPSQRPLQQPQAHLQGPPGPADRVPCTGASRSHTQRLQPTATQEQAYQQGLQPRADQTTFIRLFQIAVQSGIPQFRVFWSRAKASGVGDEWFKAAIRSLPPDVWRSVIAQLNQSGPASGTLPPRNTPPPQVSNIPGPNASMTKVLPPSIATPPMQMAPATQQTIDPGTSAYGRVAHSASGQTSGSYTAELQYYAKQATSACSAQVPEASMAPPEHIAPIQTTVTTPERDSIPQTQIDVRTPRDANKSTLARDILRSLGKTVPTFHEMRGMPTTEANEHEGDQLPDITPSQPAPHMISPIPLPVTSFTEVHSPPVPPAKLGLPDGLQSVTSPGPPTVEVITREEHEQTGAIEGAIVIDLTLEDSDESVDEQRQDPVFPIQTFTSAVTSSKPVSPANTTNHTPLMKNLSLEEPPIDSVADGDDADVRMYSPPLSFAAKENEGSEHPLLSSVGPVSPGFEQPPHEASERQLDGQLPLFLPSPPVSPGYTEPPETDLEMIADEGENVPSLKRRSVDADEMRTDTDIGTLQRVRKRLKQQVYVLIPPAPLYVKEAKKMKERAMRGGLASVSEGVGEDEELQYSHLEQLLVEESSSRLSERRCRWLSCGAILNCAANLLAHLKKHAREEDTQLPSLCRWAGCQRRLGGERECNVHLLRHSTPPLPCPFAGCDEQFDRPVEVMQHEMHHQKVADHVEPLVRKSTCQPAVPAIPARLGPPPQRLPSHHVIPRRVMKCQISADRHATVGPWVLWNIFSPIDLNMRSQNVSIRGHPARQSIDYGDMDGSNPRRDDYDFLMALSSYPTKNPQLDDLDSTLVTMSAARGLTLWGSGFAEDSAGGPGTPEAHMNAELVALAVGVAASSRGAGETKEEGRPDGSEVGVAASGVCSERQSMVVDEEDAIERMLIPS